MSKITLSVAFSLALAFILAGSDTTVWAYGNKGGSSHAGSSYGGSSYGGSSYGGTRTFEHNGRSYSSHYYRSSYRGWSSYCWYPRYGCYGYYCPTQSCWYYWYPQSNCYLPVTYLPTFTPTPLSANANQNTNVNTNISVAGGPALPAGATAVPAGATPFLPPQPK